MKCEKCSVELDENSVCKACFASSKQEILKSLEEFMDLNYPPGQYKNFNSRIKTKIRELFEKR